MIGEGIETCLAAMQATGHPAWAALSTSGMRSLALPDEVRNVIVLADGAIPVKPQHNTADSDGRTRDAAYELHGRREGLILTICCYATHPSSTVARHEARRKRPYLGRYSSGRRTL